MSGFSNQRTVAAFGNSVVKESSDAERRILFRWSFPATNAIFTFMKSNMNEKPAITPNGRQRGNGFCSSYRFESMSDPDIRQKGFCAQEQGEYMERNRGIYPVDFIMIGGRGDFVSTVPPFTAGRTQGPPLHVDGVQSR